MSGPAASSTMVQSSASTLWFWSFIFGLIGLLAASLIKEWIRSMSPMKSQTLANEVVCQILDNNEHIVSHTGTSQYIGQAGTSACGLAALNFARVILAKVDGGQKDVLHQIIAKKSTAKEITSICAGWSDRSHLDVEDICRIPLFERSLELQETKYGCPSTDEFKILLRDLLAIPTSCVVIITRPPEIIACLKLNVSGKDVFVIFDSHPRPNYPDGAGFIINRSINATAARLSELLPVDEQLLLEPDLQWQAQLLSNYSGHIFVSRGPNDSLERSTQALVESSLAILALRAEVSDLKSQNSTLTSENKRRGTEMEQMKDEHREERRKLIQTSKNHSVSSRRLTSESARITDPIAGPSHHAPNRPKPPNSPRVDQNAWSVVSRTSHSRAKHPPKQQDSDHMLAQQLQLQWMTSDQADAEIAVQQQQQLNEEDEFLRAQMEQLAEDSQSQFQCRVCLEDQSEDFVCRLQPCGHSFCRACIKDYVGAKLTEHRFPVLCPVCVTEGDKSHPSTITNALAQQVGITEEQHQTWVEMELAVFSVLLHCRKCKRSAFVDKQDLKDTEVVVCPLPGCNYIWCTACQQSITLGGPQHSCDGSSELNHLMKTRGWKYCPSCKTPIEKDTGCNHMTCMSPGCNTHFCYICGNAIVRSALTREVSAATSDHYRRCQLFEDIPGL